MTFYERLLQAAAHAGVGLKQSEIARSLGIKRQKVNKWKNGAVPETPTINEIATRWDIGHIWLASGGGQMVPNPSGPGLSQEEKEIIKFYRNAQPQRRKALYDMAKALGKAVFILLVALEILRPAPAQAFNNNNFARPEGVLFTHWLSFLMRLYDKVSQACRGFLTQPLQPCC